ncbi:hypothetical protein ACWGJ2_36130 [Streptomyces sp. NPDC054796]
MLLPVRCRIDAGRCLLPPDAAAFPTDPSEWDGVPRPITRDSHRVLPVAYTSAAACRARLDGTPPDRVGIYVASRLAGCTTLVDQVRQLVDGVGPDRCGSTMALSWWPSLPGRLSSLLRCSGPAKAFSGRGSAYGEAMWAGASALAADVIDVALVGAVESLTGESAAFAPGTGKHEGAVFHALSEAPSDDTGTGTVRWRVSWNGHHVRNEPGTPPLPLHYAQEVFTGLRHEPLRALHLGGGYQLLPEGTPLVQHHREERKHP